MRIAIYYKYNGYNMLYNKLINTLKYFRKKGALQAKSLILFFLTYTGSLKTLKHLIHDFVLNRMLQNSK